MVRVRSVWRVWLRGQRECMRERRPSFVDWSRRRSEENAREQLCQERNLHMATLECSSPFMGRNTQAPRAKPRTVCALLRRNGTHRSCGKEDQDLERLGDAHRDGRHSAKVGGLRRNGCLRTPASLLDRGETFAEKRGEPSTSRGSTHVSTRASRTPRSHRGSTTAARPSRTKEHGPRRGR